MAYYHAEEEDEADYANSVVSILQKQRGFGCPGYAGISHVYIGSHNQHFHGIGSFLGSFFRRVLLWLQRGARAVAKEAVRAGMNVASDVLSKDMNFKDSLHTRERESGKNLKRKAGETVDMLMHGSGYKVGKITRDPHSMLDRVTSRISRIEATRGKKKKRAIKKKKKKKSGKKRRTTTTTTRRKQTRKKRKISRGRTVDDIFA